MKRRRLIARKPKILSLKIEVANLLRKNLLFKERKNHVKTYWEGIIEINNLKIRIYFQYYCRARLFGRVNYVDISDFTTGKQLTKNQLIELLN